MTDDIIEFAKCKEDKKLRKLVDAIERVTKQASQENHKFLAYLLEMASMEAQTLLSKTQDDVPEQKP